MFLFFFIINTE